MRIEDCGLGDWGLMWTLLWTFTKERRECSGISVPVSRHAANVEDFMFNILEIPWMLGVIGPVSRNTGNAEDVVSNSCNPMVILRVSLSLNTGIGD